jgi:quinol monooxygenase YgiN
MAGMERVRVVAHLRAAAGKEAALQAALTAMVKPTRRENGCMRYDLDLNTGDPTDFVFVEEWATDSALEKHLKSAHVETCTAAIKTLLASPPDIRRYRTLV